MKHVSTPLYLTILLITAALLVGYSLGTPTRFPQAQESQSCTACGATLTCSGTPPTSGRDSCEIKEVCMSNGDCDAGFICDFVNAGGPTRLYSEKLCQRGCPFFESRAFPQNQNVDPSNQPSIDPFDDFDQVQQKPQPFVNSLNLFQQPEPNNPNFFNNQLPLQRPQDLRLKPVGGLLYPSTPSNSNSTCSLNKCSYSNECYAVGYSGWFGTGQGSCGGKVVGIKKDGTCNVFIMACS